MVSAKSSILMVGLVLLVASVAGCAGKNPAKPNSQSLIPPSAAAAQNDDLTCSVTGIIVDDELNPLAGAQVGLLPNAEKKTVAAEDGSFSFSFVEPGPYSVMANKAGYDSGVQAITCEAGGKVEGLQLTLAKIPDPQQSYLRLYPAQKGRIACGIGFWSLAVDDKCKELNIDSNGKNKFVYTPDAVPITAAVAELRWTASSGSGGTFLQMTYPIVTAKQSTKTVPAHNQLAAGDVVRGKSPIQLTIQSVDLNDPIYLYTANLTYMIRPSGSNINTAPGAWNPLDDGSSKLVTGQEFEHYLGLFYAGEPVPPEFSMIE